MNRPGNSSTSSSEPIAARRGGWGRALLGAVLALAIASAGLYLGRDRLTQRALQSAGLSSYQSLRAVRDAWLARTRDAAVLPGVVYGDSVFVRVFSPALQAALETHGVRSEVLDYTHVGISAFQFYYLLDGILPGRPRFAVVEVNLRSFARDWERNAGIQLAHLTSTLSLERLLRVRSALAEVQLGAVAPLAYWAEDATGMLFVLDGVRAIGTSAADALGARVNRALGLRELSGFERVGRAVAQVAVLDAAHAQWLGQEFAASPTAAILRELGTELRAAHVVPLFVVAPLDLARIAALGVSPDDLARRIGALREAIGARPDEWFETAPLVAPADFADGLHVKPDAADRLAQAVAARLAQRLAAASAGPPRATGSADPRL